MGAVFDVFILLAFFSITIFGRCPDHSTGTLCASCENKTAYCSNRCIGNSPYSKNYLTQMCPGKISEIYNIDLSLNELIRFECPVDGPSVKHLNISHNNVRFDNCSNWEHYCENFFRRLRTIDLSYNRIQQTCNASAFGFIKLESVNLSHNEIKSLNNLPFVTSAKRLQTLDVSHNMVTYIPSTFFTERQDLIKVDLRFNSIQKIALHIEISDQRLCDSDNQLSIILSDDILSTLDVSLINENNNTCQELRNQTLCDGTAEYLYSNWNNMSCNLTSEIVKSAIAPLSIGNHMACNCHGYICEQDESTTIQPTYQVYCITTNAPLITTDTAYMRGTTSSLTPQSDETIVTIPVLTTTKELELELLFYLIPIAAVVLITCIFSVCVVRYLSQLASYTLSSNAVTNRQQMVPERPPKLPKKRKSSGKRPSSKFHKSTATKEEVAISPIDRSNGNVFTLRPLPSVPSMGNTTMITTTEEQNSSVKWQHSAKTGHSFKKIDHLASMQISCRYEDDVTLDGKENIPNGTRTASFYKEFSKSSIRQKKEMKRTQYTWSCDTKQEESPIVPPKLKNTRPVSPNDAHLSSPTALLDDQYERNGQIEMKELSSIKAKSTNNVYQRTTPYSRYSHAFREQGVKQLAKGGRKVVSCIVLDEQIAREVRDVSNLKRPLSMSNPFIFNTSIADNDNRLDIPKSSTVDSNTLIEQTCKVEMVTNGDENEIICANKEYKVDMNATDEEDRGTHLSDVVSEGALGTRNTLVVNVDVHPCPSSSSEMMAYPKTISHNAKFLDPKKFSKLSKKYEKGTI
ncbi:uncharacterized protein [Apostichopus japonicus]|uniref:uncharacterized protein n=1 Tax=Stichopus japonicus TaxID=307972 RepID=UPI003AB36149